MMPARTRIQANYRGKTCRISLSPEYITFRESSPSARQFKHPPHFSFDSRGEDERVSGADAGCAVEVQESAAGFFRDDFERREIPSGRARLEPKFRLTGRHHHCIRSAA